LGSAKWAQSAGGLSEKKGGGCGWYRVQRNWAQGERTNTGLGSGGGGGGGNSKKK